MTEIVWDNKLKHHTYTHTHIYIYIYIYIYECVCMRNIYAVYIYIYIYEALVSTRSPKLSCNEPVQYFNG